VLVTEVSTEIFMGGGLGDVVRNRQQPAPLGAGRQPVCRSKPCDSGTLGRRGSATIDWTVKETVRAKMRTIVRRILRKLGYPPDKQEKAVRTVIEQAELLAQDWAA
jgi:hypothetical protein